MALTAKEKKFIDEAIFLKFNADDQFTWENMRRSALLAGYELSNNVLIAQEEAKKIFLDSQEIQDYYNERYAYFNTLLQDKRTVWNALVALETE